MLENQHVRDYRILRKLGEGGMGAVYLAEDENLGRQVAIKILSAGFGRDKQLIERFRTEARTQATLSHPNIVHLYAFFNEGGENYMVLEYAPGTTLKEVIKRTGPIPAARASIILRQLLDALSVAHQKGVVHRDIKPANIMLSERDVVKVMDFGIAKVLGEKGMTATGTALGTLYYMSPEQVRNASSVDHLSDIFSLGITLYEMLTGQLPYDLSITDDFEIRSMIVQRPLPDPRSIYPSIPEQLVAIIEKSTQKWKEDRYQSAEEILEQILQTGSGSIYTSAVSTIGTRYSQPSKMAKDETVASRKKEIVSPSESIKAKDTISLNFKWILVEGLDNSFYIASTVVTFDQYDAFCNATGRELPDDEDWGRGKRPVINVSWNDANTYCEWASQVMRKTIRLPYEKEWEFAARGGKKTNGYLYSGSNKLEEVGWFDGNSSSGYFSGRTTNSVGEKKPNELGIYDMSGNVWEWCIDRFKKGSTQVLRGGSWSSFEEYCRVSYREGGIPSNIGNDVGFRVVQEV